MRRWCVALASAVAVFLITPASPVAAHASFIGSDPVDGSVSVESPAVAELRFSEEVLADASTVRLLQLGSGESQELDLTAADGNRTLVADLPTLERGAYILRYVAVDPADLHKTVGSISFGIGVAAPPSESGEQVEGSWVLIALRAIADGALLLSAGAVVVALLAVRRGGSEPGKAVALATVSGCVTAAAWVGLLIADAVTVGWWKVRWGSLLLSSDPGRRALIGVQLALGMWWAARILRRAAPGAVHEFLIRILGVIVAGFVVVAAYGGHAGIGGSFAVGLALRVVHLGSLCIWMGAIAATWLLSRGARPVAPMWRPVSRLAALGLGITGASGLLLSGRVAVTVTALMGTSYGRAIVIKAMLLLVLAGLGGLAALRVGRELQPRRIPVEIGIACVALMLAGFLASSAPARGEQFLPLPVDDPQVVTSDLDDLTVSASIEPARPGPNLVRIRVIDTRRPSPGAVMTVTVGVSGADGTVVAERSGVPVDGLIEWTDVAIPNPGSYAVDVDITRPAAPVPPFEASWKVDVAPVPRAERVLSTRSWAPFGFGLAAAWIVIVALGRLVTRRLTRS